jgi:hypothetical protein
VDTVERGEIAESGLDNFIAQRDKQRRREEGERPAEAMWAESCRVYAEQERRRGWWERLRHHEAMIRAHDLNHALIVDGHRREADKYAELLGLGGRTEGAA